MQWHVWPKLHPRSNMRNLVIARLQECAYNGVICDSYGEEFPVAKLEQMSNEDLLALFEDVIGFNG